MVIAPCHYSWPRQPLHSDWSHDLRADFNMLASSSQLLCRQQWLMSRYVVEIRQNVLPLDPFMPSVLALGKWGAPVAKLR